MSGYYRFTQWTSKEWAVKIARNSPFPVWIARNEYTDHRGAMYCVLREGGTERFPVVLRPEDFGIEQMCKTVQD